MFLEVIGGDGDPAVDEGVLVHRVTTEHLVGVTFVLHGDTMAGMNNLCGAPKPLCYVELCLSFKYDHGEGKV